MPFPQLNLPTGKDIGDFFKFGGIILAVIFVGAFALEIYKDQKHPKIKVTNEDVREQLHTALENIDSYTPEENIRILKESLNSLYERRK